MEAGQIRQRTTLSDHLTLNLADLLNASASSSSAAHHTTITLAAVLASDSNPTPTPDSSNTNNNTSSSSSNGRTLLDIISEEEEARNGSSNTSSSSFHGWRALKNRLQLRTNSNHINRSTDEQQNIETGSTIRVSLMTLLELREREEEEEHHSVSGVLAVTEEEEEEAVTVEGQRHVCCVCMVREKGAAFIPCGHTFCRVCSRELYLGRGNCPLCNASIAEVLDIF